MPRNKDKLYQNISCSTVNVSIKGGYYIYTEASARTQNQTARLQSSIVRPTRNSATSCLSFWYHMYGSSIGGLNVYIQTGVSMGSPVWTRKGDQGNKWNNAKITITQSTQYNVRIITISKTIQYNV